MQMCLLYAANSDSKYCVLSECAGNPPADHVDARFVIVEVEVRWVCTHTVLRHTSVPYTAPQHAATHCILVCTYTHQHIQMHVSLHVCKNSAHIYTRMHACMHATDIRVTCISNIILDICTYMHGHVCIYVHIRTQLIDTDRNNHWKN